MPKTAKERALDRAIQDRVAASQEEAEAFANYQDALKEISEAERVLYQTTLDYVEADQAFRQAIRAENVVKNDIRAEREMATRREEGKAERIARTERAEQEERDVE